VFFLASWRLGGSIIDFLGDLGVLGGSIIVFAFLGALAV